MVYGRAGDQALVTALMAQRVTPSLWFVTLWCTSAMAWVEAGLMSSSTSSMMLTHV